MLSRPVPTPPPLPAAPATAGARPPARYPLAGLATSPVSVWAAFALTHVVIVLVGTIWTAPQTWGDVQLYSWWVSQGAVGAWPVFDTSWVYPVGALAPMLISMLGSPLGFAGYLLVWIVLVCALNAWAVACLVARHAYRAIYWWLAFLLFLGPICLARLDAVITPLMIVALLWVVRRPFWSGVLLTVGAWIKVVPGALFLAAWVVVRRARVAFLAAGGAVTALVVGVVALGSGLGNLTSFLHQQDGRGLQIEAVAATWFHFQRLTDPSVEFVYDKVLYTYQVNTAAARAVAANLDLVLLILVATVLLLMFAARRSPLALTAGSLALLAGLIVTNKVGSPQFITWLAVPVVVGLAQPTPLRTWSWRALAPLLWVIAGLTQLIFPWYYGPLITEVGGAMMWVIAARNVGVVVVFLLAIITLVDLVRRQPPAPLLLSRPRPANGSKNAKRIG